MLKTNILRFSLVLALGAFGVACGDEEETPVADTGATDTGATDTGATDTMEDGGMEDTMEDGGMEDSGMEDSGMEDGGMEDGGMEDTGGMETNACTNDADLAVLADGGDDAVADTAGDCGLGCLAEDDPEACSVSCIQEDHALTDACAGCYGQIVACSIEFCLAPCASDPSGEECGACQQENCVEDFNACTGLEAGGEEEGEE